MSRNYINVNLQERVKKTNKARNRSIPTSAIRGTKRRRFAEMLEEEDLEANSSTGRGAGRSTPQKKGKSTALIDAVSILASAKSEGKTRKFDFLSEHLQQQGELRRQELELELERERLAIEREKNTVEQKRTEIMMMQLEASHKRRLDEGTIRQQEMEKKGKTDSSRRGDEDIIELDYA